MGLVGSGPCCTCHGLLLGPAGRVVDFVEKPSGEALKRMANHSMHATEESPFEASMGVYVFKTETLVRSRGAACAAWQPRLCLPMPAPAGEHRLVLRCLARPDEAARAVEVASCRRAQRRLTSGCQGACAAAGRLLGVP